MKFLTVAVAFRSFAPLMGQLFYNAIPGSYSGLGSAGVPFYTSQPSYHSDPKYFASSQMALPYYQDFQPGLKGYQAAPASKGFTQPVPLNPKVSVEPVRLPQPIQAASNLANVPLDDQDSGAFSAPMTKRPRQIVGAPRDGTKPAAEREVQERPADESYADSPSAQETEDSSMQSQLVSEAAYSPNSFPQSSFVQPPFSQPMPSAAYGVNNVRFGEVEHSCKEVKICVPVDPKNCWKGDHQAVRSFVFNQTDSVHDFSQANLPRRRRKIRKVVFSMPTTPSPEKKPGTPMAISKRKHTAPVVENQPPYKIFELADPNKKVTFEPGNIVTTARPAVEN